MKAAPISKGLTTQQNVRGTERKRPTAKSKRNLRGVLSRPPKTLTLKEMDAGVTAPLTGKHAPGKAA